MPIPPEAYAFVEKRLDVNELAMFNKLLEKPRECKLLMVACSVEAWVSGSSRIGTRGYRIHPEYSDKRTVEYPPDARISELAEQYLPDSGFEILERQTGYKKDLLVRIKTRSKPLQRKRFVQALAKEAQFID